MIDKDLIKDGEIRETDGFWYAIYEFHSPINTDQEIIIKRALLYKLMAFLETSDELQFFHRITISKDFRNQPDFLGRNEFISPFASLIIERR